LVHKWLDSWAKEDQDELLHVSVVTITSTAAEIVAKTVGKTEYCHTEHFEIELLLMPPNSTFVSLKVTLQFIYIYI
jgi:hypothetical protein